MAENDSHYNGFSGMGGSSESGESSPASRAPGSSGVQRPESGNNRPQAPSAPSIPWKPDDSDNTPSWPSAPDNSDSRPSWPPDNSDNRPSPPPAPDDEDDEEDEDDKPPKPPAPPKPSTSDDDNSTSWLPVYPAPGSSSQYYGQVRLLNASANTFPVNLTIDGTAYVSNSRFGSLSDYDWVSDGFHTVTIRRATGPRSVLLQQILPFTAGQKTTLVLTDSASGSLSLPSVTDTACSNLAYNAGCYRFANMTYSGSRVNLMSSDGQTVFGNIGFQSVSSYKQAVAGSYPFYVTMSTSYNFLNEIPILIGSGQSAVASSDPLLSFQVDISAGQNYTTYLIGNTWSDGGLTVVTAED
ncbi:MAG: DUF4397 domain-containing protein [Clostridiales bacterium]|nr:DUF4397 domain-containing protein [Clostridiales bacterium]